MSWLGDVCGSSGFSAVDFGIGDDLGSLRGVRKCAEGASAENDDVADAYKTLVGHPDKITPQMYAVISGLVSNYLAKVAKQ